MRSNLLHHLDRAAEDALRMLRPIAPDDLHWSQAEQPCFTVAACPICGRSSAQRHVLEVASLAPPHQQLTLLRCAGCDSGFFDPPGVTSFADLGQLDDGQWRFYVEVGGGVWETIWPALVHQREQPARLLDVGCGFGFLVDYWRRIAGGEAVGVELADYGRMGAQLLDIPVYHQLLQDCAELSGQRFDVVYASEVVEHVPDPAGFIRLLASYLADDGVLVLTTPAMQFITPSNTSTTLLAALAPGFHGFLLSERAFGELARAAGFQHVEVRVFGERQILWASHAPLRLDLSLNRLRPSYLAYFDDWFARGKRDSPLWQGYTYRYTRELVNDGRLNEAKDKADALTTALIGRYGPEIARPMATLARARSCADLTEFGRIAPYFLPAFYMLLGTIARRGENDPAAAIHWYQAAAELGVTCSRLGSLFFLEVISLIWPARTMAASILLEQGRQSAAEAIIVALARDGPRCSAEHGYAVASEELIDETVQRVCLAWARQGAWQAVQRVSAAYLGGLQARFPGHNWTEPETIAEWAAGRIATGPRNAALALLLQGLLDQATQPNIDSDRLKQLVAMAAADNGPTERGSVLKRNAAIVGKFLERYRVAGRGRRVVGAPFDQLESTKEDPAAANDRWPVGADRDRLLADANRSYERGDFALADELLAQALLLSPDDLELHHLQGCARLRRNENELARASLARARTLAPEHPIVNYNFGNACGALGDYAAAAKAMLTATRAPHAASDAWSKIGGALKHLENPAAAAPAMLRAARLNPHNGPALMGIAACGLDLVREGKRAAVRTWSKPIAGRLSFVVCSLNPQKIDRLRARLEVLLTGADWELVTISNARSLCEGYNRGIKQSSGELLVLCHDDILLLADDFERRLRGYLSDFDLIGVAGGTKINGPSWSWSGPPHIHCWIAHPGDGGRPEAMLLGTRGPVVPKARVLDGVLLAGRRSVFDCVRFDEKTFDGFHLYDIDFSYRASRAGVRAAACLDLGVLHESPGRYDAVWKGYAERFMRKFPEINRRRTPLTIGQALLDEPAQLVHVQDWFAFWTLLSDDEIERTVRAAVEAL